MRDLGKGEFPPRRLGKDRAALWIVRDDERGARSSPRAAS